MVRWITALLFFLFLLAASREPPWADAHVVYDTTQALIDRGALDIYTPGQPYFFTFYKGKKYGFASLGNVLALVPSYVAYRKLRHLPGLPDRPFFALCSHLSSSALMAGAAGFFFLLCRRRGASLRLATLLSLALGLCTLCFCYARSPYSEALQTFALIFLVERTLAQAERITAPGMFALGVAAGILFNAKLVYALVMPLCGLYLLWGQFGQGTPPRVARVLGGIGAAILGFLPFLGLALWHNWMKTGSPFHTGYQGQIGIFTGDLFPGLYGYALSSGKGLFYYSPPLVLALLGVATSWRRRRGETLLLLSIIGTAVLFSAKYLAWHGDYAWGPRYMVPLTPLFLLLSLPWLPEALATGRTRLRRMALGTLLTAGLCVQLLGASLYWDHYIRVLSIVRDQTEKTDWSPDHFAFGYYIPHFSPLAGTPWLLRHLCARDPDLNRDPPWKNILPAKLDLVGTWTRLRLDWWAADWFRLPRTQTSPLDPPGPADAKVARDGLFILGLFCFGAVFSGARLLSALRRRENVVVVEERHTTRNEAGTAH